MKNDKGFIHSKFIQPDYYKKFVHNWAAVYFIGDNEYHIQSVSDPYDVSNENIVGFEILRQSKNGRNNVRGCGNTFTNVKMAIDIIESLILKNRKDEENMKKFIMAEATENNMFKVVVTNQTGEKEYLSGDYSNFIMADEAAKNNSQTFDAEYVSNR